ncbi:MAG: 2OG-Fe(II) oxygenase family protein [Woeseiaceae bacterium]|jgi:Rps23 Pro-64 3,4-dihydroxylase Tpa1-like proline 4-hydroxylase
MLNPDLDIDALARQYAEDDRVRIPNFLDPDFAERVHRACRDDVPYEYICHIDGNNVVIPEQDLKSMSREEQAALNNNLIESAARGVGFFYSGYQMRRAQPTEGDDKLTFLHSLFEFVNSEQMLSLISQISGRKDINSADAHFTRYTSGQYLTRHTDNITAEGRRIAYVMSFTKDWHPDWGGLLHFYESDGAPRDFWVPVFNSLNLFDVRHTHSVSYVTPFARNQRLSLTGWFCG